MIAKIEEIDGKYVATLEGEMDTAAATEAEEVLKPLYQSNGRDVIIQCKGLEYIASSGLRILLGIFLIVCGVIHIVLGIMIRLGRSNPQMKEPWNFYVRFNGIVMVAVAIGYIFIAGILLGKPLLVVLFHLVSMIVLLVLARDRKTSKTKRKDAAS